GFEPCAFQCAAQACGKRQLQGAQGLGRQLLGPYFHEEVVSLGGLHAGAPAVGLPLPVWVPFAPAAADPAAANIGKPSASRLAKYACATALANALTRRM